MSCRHGGCRCGAAVLWVDRRARTSLSATARVARVSQAPRHTKNIPGNKGVHQKFQRTPITIIGCTGDPTNQPTMGIISGRVFKQRTLGCKSADIIRGGSTDKAGVRACACAGRLALGLIMAWLLPEAARAWSSMGVCNIGRVNVNVMALAFCGQSQLSKVSCQRSGAVKTHGRCARLSGARPGRRRALERRPSGRGVHPLAPI